jgi:phage terminase large subunit
MQSIRESVHQLLEAQIQRLGLQADHEVKKAEIIGRNGTSFTFHGLRDQSVHSIKSLDRPGYPVGRGGPERLQEVLATMIPTIRKPGSEIWVSFNPELETDDTYRRFVLNPPPGAVVVKTSRRDNPALSDCAARTIISSRRAKPRLKQTRPRSFPGKSFPIFFGAGD